MNQIKKSWHLFALGIIVAISLTLATTSASKNSLTADENAHIAAGFVKLHDGYFDFFIEQPPLINAFEALPLILSGIKFDTSVINLNKNHWSVGSQFIFNSGHDPDRLMLLARIPIIILYGLLIISVYYFTRKISRNSLAGLIGATLTAFCPNLLAHGGLATVDLGVTFFLFLSIGTFFLTLQEITRKRMIMLGVFIGLALASKVSGLIIFPYFFLIFGLFLITGKTSKKNIYFMIEKYKVAIIISFVVLLSIYFFMIGKDYLSSAYGDSSVVERIKASFFEYAKQLKAIYYWSSKPYDKPQFLLGQFSFSGWWYYYPVAFFFKTPIPILILLFAGMLGLFFKLRKNLQKIYSDNILGSSLFALLFILLFFMVAASSHLNIGLRYVLPVYPVIYLFIGLMFASYYDQIKKKLAYFICLTFLVIWAIIGSIQSLPSFLAYFNEFAGKPVNYDKILIDSNLDWGQDLKRLRTWMNKNGIEKIHLDYFGGGGVDYYLKDRYIPSESYGAKEAGYYAISRHNFRTSSFYAGKIQTWEDATKEMKLRTIIGNSIYVFQK